ncbi:hypothetical protein ACT3SP_02160 [Brachybacterium sp. AOP43-C2-M15]|uniref:hypothetical protein n=1 Tax=Brachybacterium sp. AOP43-C2-M15 TaxID=3457661 RepID=UPI004034D8F6
MTEEQQAQQREREAVLSEYGTWRITADEDAPVAEEIRTLETLLRLKAEHLESPDPGLWTEELAAALLTDVVPRTVIQPREQVMDMVPSLVRFVSYLRETGRWHPEAISATEAPAMLGELEFATLEAADDPTRRSFSTNILGYGMALGVDLEDEDELAAFMHWYNALPDEERLTLSETGRLPTPSVPYDRTAALDAARSDRRAAVSWPWFLPAPEDEASIAIEDLLPEEEHEVYSANDFVRRAAAILDFVGETGRRVTGTGALGRADCAELLDAGVDSGGDSSAVRTMWDRPDLVGPWITLLDGGWLDITGGRVHRERGPVPWVPEEVDAEAFAAFGHAVLTATLFGKDAREAEDGGFRGMPDTISALLAACGPSGLVLHEPLSEDPQAPQVPIDGGTGQWDRRELARYFAVERDLVDLAEIGVLDREGRRFSGSAAVMVALVALIKEHGATGEASGPLG